MATLQASVSSEISANPETVFKIISDPARMSEWINGVQSAEWEEGSSVRAGGKFKMEYKYARKVNDITMEITAAEPGALLEYKTVDGPYPINARFTLRPSGTNTVLAYNQIAHSDSKLSALGFKLTGWFARSMMQRMLKKDLERLNDAVSSAS